MDSAKFRRHGTTLVIFSSGARARVGGQGTLVYFLSGAVGGHPGLGISFCRSTLARWGGPGTWEIFSSVAGRADGPW